MSFTIPNLAAAGFPDQAEPDSVDFDILALGSNMSGVKSGCAVTAQGSPDMTVAVASGTIYTLGTQKTVTSGNVTIAAADGTNPRFDLIVADSSAAKQRRAGTAAANPVFPTLTAGDVALAAVYVPASDTAINSNQIIDKRVMMPTLWYIDGSGRVTTDGALNINAAVLTGDGGGALYTGSSIFPGNSAGDFAFFAPGSGGPIIHMSEIADPGAGAANTGRIYVRDNGSGKTQLAVRFATGSVQVLATEP